MEKEQGQGAIYDYYSFKRSATLYIDEAYKIECKEINAATLSAMRKNGGGIELLTGNYHFEIKTK